MDLSDFRPCAPSSQRVNPVLPDIPIRRPSNPSSANQHLANPSRIIHSYKVRKPLEPKPTTNTRAAVAAAQPKTPQFPPPTIGVAATVTPPIAPVSPPSSLVGHGQVPVSMFVESDGLDYGAVEFMGNEGTPRSVVLSMARAAAAEANEAREANLRYMVWRDSVVVEFHVSSSCLE